MAVTEVHVNDALMVAVPGASGRLPLPLPGELGLPRPPLLPGAAAPHPPATAQGRASRTGRLRRRRLGAGLPGTLRLAGGSLGLTLGSRRMSRRRVGAVVCTLSLLGGVVGAALGLGGSDQAEQQDSGKREQHCRRDAGTGSKKHVAVS
ncbi:MAG TPA: hypothetical protein VM307_01750 [Egibacteraceae bacterium]|nr:hypothetical protein [Egibacteraceae bacterium]